MKFLSFFFFFKLNRYENPLRIVFFSVIQTFIRMWLTPQMPPSALIPSRTFSGPCLWAISINKVWQLTKDLIEQMTAFHLQSYENEWSQHGFISLLWVIAGFKISQVISGSSFKCAAIAVASTHQYTSLWANLKLAHLQPNAEPLSYFLLSHWSSFAVRQLHTKPYLI